MKSVSNNNLASNKNKKILVIDDMPPMRELIKGILRKAGYATVVDSPDGLDGISLLQHKYFDLVICDWFMPKMDGYQVLQQIRQDKGLKDILFMMVTIESEKESVALAVKAGVDGYLLKPVKPATLLQKVEDVFKKQKRFNPEDIPEGKLTLENINLHLFDK